MSCYFGEFNIGLANNPLIDIFLYSHYYVIVFPFQILFKKNNNKNKWSVWIQSLCGNKCMFQAYNIGRYF